MSVAKKTAYCGVLTALALIFSYVESLIPINFGVPGIKLGLANLIVLLGLYFLKPGYVLVISVMRIMLAGFMFGNAMSIIYSLAGGVLSFIVMVILKKTNVFSITGMSIAGAVGHNAGQLIVAILVVSTGKLVFYLPALMVAGVLTGALIGIAAGGIINVVSREAGRSMKK